MRKTALAAAALVSAMAVGSMAQAATVDYKFSAVNGTKTATSLFVPTVNLGTRTLDVNITAFSGAGTLNIANTVTDTTMPIATFAASYVSGSINVTDNEAGNVYFTALFKVTSTNNAVSVPVGGQVLLKFSGSNVLPTSGSWGSYSVDAVVTAAAVPLPTSVASGAALLGGLGLVRRRK